MDAVVVFGFVAAVLGGLDSPVGAVVGGLLLGLSLSFVSGYVGSELVALAALVILMLVLHPAPGGLFAQHRGDGGSDDGTGSAASGGTRSSPGTSSLALAVVAGRGRSVLESVERLPQPPARAMAYLGIAAGGLTVLTGLNGQISLGHGALMAIGAYTTALLLPDQERRPRCRWWCSLAIADHPRRRRGRRRRRRAAARPLPRRRHARAGRRGARHRAVLRASALGGEQGLSVVLPDIPGWVLDAAFFVTGSELTSTAGTSPTSAGRR